MNSVKIETADYIDTLSSFACETQLADIPPEVCARCGIIIADTLAVIAAGNDRVVNGEARLREQLLERIGDL